jgi:hypothetical protein
MARRPTLNFATEPPGVSSHGRSSADPTNRHALLLEEFPRAARRHASDNVIRSTNGSGRLVETVVPIPPIPVGSPTADPSTTLPPVSRRAAGHRKAARSALVFSCTNAHQPETPQIIILSPVRRCDYHERGKLLGVIGGAILQKIYRACVRCWSPDKQINRCSVVQREIHFIRWIGLGCPRIGESPRFPVSINIYCN